MQKKIQGNFEFPMSKLSNGILENLQKLLKKFSNFSIFPMEFPMGNSTLRGRSGLRSDVQLVAGPSTIQTLRGQLCGREAGFGRSIWMGFTLW